MSRRKAIRRKRSKLGRTRHLRWVLTVDTEEAAVNLYSILLAFHQSEGGGLVDRKSTKYIAKWLKIISEQVPDVRDLASDDRGPLRERHISPVNVSLDLDSRERALMLFICKTLYGQLCTSEGRRDWIKNQDRADYELAVKNFRGWVNTLEGEGAPAD